MAMWVKQTSVTNCQLYSATSMAAWYVGEGIRIPSIGGSVGKPGYLSSDDSAPPAFLGWKYANTAINDGGHVSRFVLELGAGQTSGRARLRIHTADQSHDVDTVIEVTPMEMPLDSCSLEAWAVSSTSKNRCGASMLTSTG